jgi:hypothetical protein
VTNGVNTYIKASFQDFGAQMGLLISVLSYLESQFSLLRELNMSIKFCSMVSPLSFVFIKIFLLIHPQFLRNFVTVLLLSVNGLGLIIFTSNTLKNPVAC